jgi:cytoskeletal protein CcmA (bactofilin family)
MAKTYLSSDFKLNGNIKSQGDIEIDGQIKGKVIGNSVSVLASGSVDGSISGTSISIDGKANGVISASDLAVASSGTVMADITYETLSTDKGAKLQGNLKVK